jgi:hypothetical protein
MRNAAVAQITLAIRREFPLLHQSLAVYVIGGAAAAQRDAPKDFDLLLIRHRIRKSQNQQRLRRLVQAMASGDPFNAAFNSTSVQVRATIDRIAKHVCPKFSGLNITMSCAFGPARGEVRIPDSTLHIHVAGPITKGDLEILERVMPFHAASFLHQHRKLVGPPLATLLSGRQPTLRDLVYWDEILIRRVANAPTPAQANKWIKRMIANRAFVNPYKDTYRNLLVKFEMLSKSSRGAMFDSFLETLTAAPRDLLQASRRRFQ